MMCYKTASKYGDSTEEAETTLDPDKGSQSFHARQGV